MFQNVIIAVAAMKWDPTAVFTATRQAALLNMIIAVAAMKWDPTAVFKAVLLQAHLLINQAVILIIV